MDTRTGLGGRTGALPSGGLAHLQVTGASGLPAAVGSVTLNVTVVTPTAAGSASAMSRAFGTAVAHGGKPRLVAIAAKLELEQRIARRLPRPGRHLLRRRRARW